MNIASLLARAGRSDGDRTAVVVGTEAVADYRALARRAAGLASALGETFVLTPGDRVALVMRNCAAYIEALFALLVGRLHRRAGQRQAAPARNRLHPRAFRRPRLLRQRADLAE